MQQGRGLPSDGYDGYGRVHWAATYDDAAALSVCLDGDAECITRGTCRGMTPLHICALNNSAQCARALLLLLPVAAINATNCWGETPLHLACACDAVDVRALLLDAGADAFVRDAWGRPACEAVAASHAQPQHECAELPAPPLPPDPSGCFNDELKSAITSRKLRSVPPPIVRGIFTDAPLTPATPSASARSSRRSLSCLVEYPGDHDRVVLLLQDATIDAAGADSFGLTGAFQPPPRSAPQHSLSSTRSCSQIRFVEQVRAAAAAADASSASSRRRRRECSQCRQQGALPSVPIPPFCRPPNNFPQWTALHFCVDMRAHDALALLVQGTLKRLAATASRFCFPTRLAFRFPHRCHGR
jgi:hypothetical protein